MKIVFTDWVPDVCLTQIPNHIELVLPSEGHFSHEELLFHLQSAEALFTLGRKIRVDFLEELRKESTSLRFIATASVGKDHLPLAYLAEKKITVINAPQSARIPTAELTVGITLALLRRILIEDKNYRKERTIRRTCFGAQGTGLIGKTVGIMGLGRIGKTVAEIFSLLGAEIIYFQRNPVPESAGLPFPVKYVSREELLKASDIISFHIPYSPDDYHFINKESIEKMKDGVYIINAARGKLIDEQDLVEALKKGKVAGAALDVFDHEPVISEELASLENVVLTPHIGTYTKEARIATVNEALQMLLSCMKD